MSALPHNKNRYDVMQACPVCGAAQSKPCVSVRYSRLRKTCHPQRRGIVSREMKPVGRWANLVYHVMERENLLLPELAALARMEKSTVYRHFTGKSRGPGMTAEQAELYLKAMGYRLHIDVRVQKIESVKS